MPITSTDTTRIPTWISVGVPVVVMWLLIPLTFVIPLIDSTRAPYFDLTQEISMVAYLLSQSAGKYGALGIILIMLTLMVTRQGLTNSERFREITIILIIVAFFAGGGAAINEHIIKAHLKIPRPNILWLAGENGTGPLGRTAKDFYEVGNKSTRSVVLTNVLKLQNTKPLPMSSSIEAHWIEETGYSFPSGHSFSAMFFATFFLAMASTFLNTRRLDLFYLLLPWAVAVCYSRLVLRVHTPLDVTVGSLQGIVIGFFAWAMAKKLIQRSSFDTA